MKSFLNFVVCGCVLLSQCCCDPFTIVAGTTAVAGVGVLRGKDGVQGAMSDADIHSAIYFRFSRDDKDLFNRVEIAVKNSRVLLIGGVKDLAQKDLAIKIAREVVPPSVTISDAMYVGNLPSASNFASDALITSRIKSSMIVDGNVSSFNYEVTTHKGITYILGLASSKYEKDVVLHHARSTSGVKKVFSYIKLVSDK